MPKNISTNYENPKVYAVKHKNEEIRAASRSGGVFTALSDEILKVKCTPFVRQCGIIEIYQ